MKHHIAEYAISSVVALSLMVIARLALYGTRSTVGGFDVLLLPGFFLGGIFFPQGIHSDLPYVYIATAFIIDGFLFGLPALLLCKLLKSLRRDDPPK